MSQIPDTEPGNYYVSARRDDGRYILLDGPFPNDHAGALAAVDRALAKAMDLDPRAPWYSYGTVRLPLEYKTPGVLNRLLEET